MQIPYLPQGHNIILMEQIEYEEKYQIDKYYNNQKIRFCVTMLSKNNIEQGRYWKVLRTILQQNYSNYHIVFIDDNSKDETLSQTINYFKQHKFPSNKLVFVRNKKQMFATYNIVNAAYSYCDIDDVQILIDGDDQLIGRYVFSTFNALYQNFE